VFFHVFVSTFQRAKRDREVPVQIQPVGWKLEVFFTFGAFHSDQVLAAGITQHHRNNGRARFAIDRCAQATTFFARERQDYVVLFGFFMVFHFLSSIFLLILPLCLLEKIILPSFP
jgi:hypothetical protein